MGLLSISIPQAHTAPFVSQKEAGSMSRPMTECFWGIALPARNAGMEPAMSGMIVIKRIPCFPYNYPYNADSKRWCLKTVYNIVTKYVSPLARNTAPCYQYGCETFSVDAAILRKTHFPFQGHFRRGNRWAISHFGVTIFADTLLNMRAVATVIAL